ncbi:MAG: hypothetical protein WCI92_12490 [Bacteroidota bacterium]
MKSVLILFLFVFGYGSFQSKAQNISNSTYEISSKATCERNNEGTWGKWSGWIKFEEEIDIPEDLSLFEMEWDDFNFYAVIEEKESTMDSDSNLYRTFACDDLFGDEYTIQLISHINNKEIFEFRVWDLLNGYAWTYSVRRKNY